MTYEDEEALIEMPIDMAKGRKWEWGNEKYGPEFQGCPLVKLHSECVDSLNYIDQVAEDNLASPWDIVEMRGHIYAVAELTRRIHAERKKQSERL